jgi:hypothetical protein
MNTAGKKTWAFAGGHIPVESTGSEPENTSRDEFCFLNAGLEEAQVEITLFYSDRDPVGPYSLKILPRRVRRIRINDLINPEAPPLGKDYGALVESNRPLVVQLERTDTSRPGKAILSSMGFPLS